jgi:cystatin-A/B
MSTTGGLTSAKKPDDETKQILNEIKPLFEKKLNKNFNKFNLHSYKTQVVSGTNYFIKVELDNEEHTHLRIFKSFNNNMELVSFKYPLTKEDQIEYF